MKKQKRIPVKGGSARVDEDCSQETIDMVNRLAELAYDYKPEEKEYKVEYPNCDCKNICYFCYDK